MIRNGTARAVTLIVTDYTSMDLVSSLREIVVIADLRLRLERLSRLKSLKVREQAPAEAP